VQQSSPTRWSLHWHCAIGWEGRYVPEQVLRGVELADICPPPPDPHSIAPCSHCLLVMRNRDFGGCKPPRCRASTNLQLLRAYLRQNSTVAIVVLGDELLPAPCGEGTCTSGGEWDSIAWDNPVPRAPDVRSHSRFEASCAEHAARRQFYELAPLVLRQYWTPGCAARENVLTIPLGIKSNRVHTTAARLSADRAYVWSFASAHSTPLRTQLVNVLADAPELSPSAVRYPGVFANYTEILCSSLLALTPSGHSPDTWRAMESLDCGALPIMDAVAKEYYSQWLPRNLTSLFVVLNTSSARALKKSVVRLRKRSRRAVEAKRIALVDAYEAWKQHQLDRIYQRLAALSDRHVSSATSSLRAWVLGYLYRTG
jgi:hypothetical protein